jgi:hypothetical protein
MKKTDEILTSPYIGRVNILVLGNFNPTIFHPEWFDRYKILPAQETQALITPDNQDIITNKIEEARIVVTPMASVARFPSITLQVDQKHLEVFSNKSEDYFVLSNTILKISNLLSHTPVKTVRFYFHAHLLFNDDGHYILNNLLASRSDKLINVLGDKVKLGGNFVIKEESHTFYLLLEESNKLERGIYFRFRFDRKLKDMENLIKLINQNFESDFRKSEKIILELCGKPIKRLGDD